MRPVLLHTIGAAVTAAERSTKTGCFSCGILRSLSLPTAPVNSAAHTTTTNSTWYQVCFFFSSHPLPGKVGARHPSRRGRIILRVFHLDAPKRLRLESLVDRGDQNHGASGERRTAKFVNCKIVKLLNSWILCTYM